MQALVLYSVMPSLVKPFSLLPVISGFEKLGTRLSEVNRDLAKFHDRIAESFAQLDFARLRSRMSVARATAGSAGLLNDQLRALIHEVQPLRESITSFLNQAGSSLVFIARMMAALLKWTPGIANMVRTAQAVERWLGRNETREMQGATKDFLRAIRDGTFRMPPRE